MAFVLPLSVPPSSRSTARAQSYAKTRQHCPKRVRGHAPARRGSGGGGSGAHIAACAQLQSDELAKKEVVYLASSRAGDSGARIVAQALSREDCRILSVCMDSCEITDAGVQELAKGISVCRSLEELNLADNHIAGQGISALAEALAAPTCKVRSLYLASNAIGPEGGAALGRSLEYNKALQTIFLMGQIKKGPGIGDQGAEAWAHGISKNSGAFWFANLNNNNISESGFNIIRQARVEGKHHVFPLDPFRTLTYQSLFSFLNQWTRYFFYPR